MIIKSISSCPALQIDKLNTGRFINSFRIKHIKWYVFQRLSSSDKCDSQQSVSRPSSCSSTHLQNCTETFTCTCPHRREHTRVKRGPHWPLSVTLWYGCVLFSWRRTFALTAPANSARAETTGYLHNTGDQRFSSHPEKQTGRAGGLRRQEVQAPEARDSPNTTSK